MTPRRRTVDLGASLFAVPSDAAPFEERLGVIAGLDEAGFGPLLGPLTIGCVALRTADAGLDPWVRLAPIVGRADERDATRLAVGDSKAVFERNARGRARLERTVLAFHSVLHGVPEDARAFLDATPPPCGCDEIRAEFWRAALPTRLEGLEDGTTARTAAALRGALDAVGLELVVCGVRAVPSSHLNASFARTESKGTTHWEQCAPFLARLWDEFGCEGIDLVVDRHGGRMRYAALLATTFAGSNVSVLSEVPERSVYWIHGPGGRRVRATFAEKADTLSFPVALASCCAKYARELAMTAFNAHFIELQPALAPTAGYVTDARRWLAEAGPALSRAGLAPVDLIRTR